MEIEIDKMEEKIKRYVKRRRFPSYEECVKKMESNTGFSRYQYVICKKIYENLWDDQKIVTYGKIMYEVSGWRGLENSCILMNIIFENTKLKILQSYGRKLEFLFQGVTEEWDA